MFEEVTMQRTQQFSAFEFVTKGAQLNAAHA